MWAGSSGLHRFINLACNRRSSSLERIGAKFDIDHFHGACEGDHPPGKKMCRECIRGMIHRKCNWELIWLDRAVAAGRGGILAPHVEAYLTGRPFLLAAAA